MAPKRTGLGRGIGALIPTATDQQDRPVDVFFPTGGSPASAPTADELVAVPGARLANLNPLDVIPNGQQPRKEFREEELQGSSTPSVRSACCSPSWSARSPGLWGRSRSTS